MGQAFPTAADANDFAVVLATAIHDALDNGVQAGDVSAAGEDSKSLFRHIFKFQCSG